jgi:hypothetical protein
LRKPSRVDASSRQRILARIALAFVAALVAVTVTLNGSPLGASAGPLQASGSPSPAPTGPSIQLWNPAQGYDPGFDASGQMPPDPPKISDKFDGIDRAYHVVATVAGAPANPLVEASIVIEGENERTVGTLSPAPASPEVWEMFWEVPDSLPDGPATFRVRLYEQTASGTVERGIDEVEVDIEQHEPPADSQQADETIELTWPTQGGQLGFYKPRGGVWRTVIEGTTSSRNPRPSGGPGAGTTAPAIGLAYSTTAPGREPQFTSCASNIAGGGLTADGRRPFSLVCPLAGNTLPTQVTAIAAIAEETDNPEHSGLQTQDSADVHRVAPYVQTPDQMTAALIPTPGSGTNDRARRLAGSGCLTYFVEVVDHLKRPVIGANVDMHIDGPTDQVQFATDTTTNPAENSGTFKNPDRGHGSENGAACDAAFPDGEIGDPMDTQGEHNVPGGDDVKHRESVGGTSVNGGGGAGANGRFRFHIYSATAGFTNITAWVDEEDLVTLTEQRPADNDVLDPGEPVATARAQWYSQAPTLSIVPVGESAPAGTCTDFLLSARSGNAPIPGINLDVHATGPNDELDFCDPGGGTPRRAPDLGQHGGEDSGEGMDEGATPRSQHTEGETNDEGNFLLGIVSPAPGDTTLAAWLDGEKDFDNDVQGAATAEPATSATMSWASSSGDVTVSFLNPSPFGGVRKAARQVDSDGRYHIVARVDAPTFIQGLEFQLGTGSGESFAKTKDLGTATQVAGSDTYELTWPVDVADGDYTLRAQVVGSPVVADASITVNNTQGMNPSDVPDATLELTRPLNVQPVFFSSGSTPVEGIASAGAEGVDVFYTKQGANITLAASHWIRCGFLQLDGRGNAPQPFKTTCALVGSDLPTQVTAIAAVPFDCQEPLPGSGCNAAANALPSGRNPGALDSGDAHRVFGLASSPRISISPAENEAGTGSCLKSVLRVTDPVGQALTGQNVDVHVSGPGDSPHFCNPEDGSASARRAPDQGGHSAVSGASDQGAHVSDQFDVHHTEGETNAEGRFVFGVTGNEAGDSQVFVWVDRNENDVPDGDESNDTALLHWVAPSGCTQVGTAQGDVLTGTADPDRICGKGGNDVIRGLGGDDVLLAGPGNDVVRGGGGNDTINASRGKDQLFGGEDDDTLKGAAGADRIAGGEGTDDCQGGPGRDRLKGCEGGGGSAALSPRLVRGGVV